MFSVLKTKALFDSKIGIKSNADFPLTMQQQLDYAQPAESARTPMVSSEGAGADYDYLRAMKVHDDGLWLCCCGFENKLVHWTGPFPFKHLKCGECEHVLCDNCETTEILTPWNPKMGVIPDANGLRLLQVCPSCGLSHRAVVYEDHNGKHLEWVPKASHSYAETCHYGHLAGFKWLQYAIRSPGIYQLSHKAATRELKEKRSKAKSHLSKEEDAVQFSQKCRASLHLRAAKPWLETYNESPYRYDSAQNTPARSSNREYPELVKKPPKLLWECPGISRQQGLNLSQNPYNSVQNNLVYSPTHTPTQSMSIPQARQPAPLAVDTNTSSLKRSGAQRVKHGVPYTPRSASYQDSPVSPRLHLTNRSMTWANAADFLELRDHAEASLKITLGEVKYNVIKDSAEGELLIQDVIREQFLNPESPVHQYATRCDSSAEDESYARAGVDRIANLVISVPDMHAPTPMRRAVTYDQLLENAEDIPEVETPTRVMVSEEVAQDKTDWAVTYKLYKKNMDRSP